MQLGQCVWKLACSGVQKTDGSKTCGWWGQGWQRLGQYWGNVRVNVQNLQQVWVEKVGVVESWLGNWRKRYKDINRSWPHMDSKPAKDKTVRNWDSVFYTMCGRSREGSYDGKGWAGNKTTLRVACPPSLLCLHIWTSTRFLAPVAAQNAKSSFVATAGQQSWQRQLRRGNDKQDSGAEKQLRVSNSCACPCFMKGARVANPPICL